LQEERPDPLTVSVVFLHRSIYKLLQNVKVNSLGLDSLERLLQVSLTRLIKDHVLLAGSTAARGKAQLPKAHSISSNLNWVGQSKSVSEKKVKSPDVKADRGGDGSHKRGTFNNNSFLSLYHALLIDYPGRRRVPYV
jgi:hypothetical protein